MISGRAFEFSGVKGENVEEIPVPESMKVCVGTVWIALDWPGCFYQTIKPPARFVFDCVEY